MREVTIRSEELDLLSSDVLAKGGLLRFVARGSSMAPSIADGDALVVGPVEPSSLRPGRIVLYRSGPGRVAAHRMIGRLPSDKGCAEQIVVRGDSSGCREEFVETGNVVGLVIALERDGGIVPTDRGYLRLAGWLYSKSPLWGLLLADPRRAVRAIGARLLIGIQGTRTYRMLAGRLTRHGVDYREASGEDGPALAPFLGASVRDATSEPQLKAETDRGVTGRRAVRLIAVRGACIAGSVVLQPCPSNPKLCREWWLFGLVVRVAFRGAGMGSKLVELALERAAAQDADVVKVLVRGSNRPALGLYGKLGFAPIPIESLGDDSWRASVQDGNDWLVLSRNLR